MGQLGPSGSGGPHFLLAPCPIEGLRCREEQGLSREPLNPFEEEKAPVIQEPLRTCPGVGDIMAGH